MFTGIITDIGKIINIEKNPNQDVIFEIKTNYQMDKIAIGASIACNGVCLTVISKTNQSFKVQASNETLSKTNLGYWKIDTEINLEQALKIGDELGGHMVSGHVDTIAKILSINKIDSSHQFIFEIPKDFAKFIAPKGSITIDGTSLTVNEVTKDYFSVNIIPHSFNNTIFKHYDIGLVVNIEIDLIARYLANLVR